MPEATEQKQTPTSVVFVCTGNTCRSPMAEAYLRHGCGSAGPVRVVVASAGVCAGDGEPMSSQAAAALRAAGVTAPPHGSQLLRRSLVESADLIVAMTSSHVRAICRQFPEARDKVRLLMSYCGTDTDVPDPFGGPEREYAACLTRMRPALDALIAEVTA